MADAWDEQWDVIVAGCGYAGAAAAIAAHDAGARVLVVEKMPDAGGISVCSAGGLRVAFDRAAAFAYLKATNRGATPDDVFGCAGRRHGRAGRQIAGAGAGHGRRN